MNGSVTMTLTGGSIAADNTTLSFTGYELSSEEGLTFGEDAITFSGIKGGIAASATISNSTLSSPAFSNITLPADGTGITLKLNNEDVSYDNVINQLDASTSV